LIKFLIVLLNKKIEKLGYDESDFSYAANF
jgi:hypothetical protein